MLDVSTTVTTIDLNAAADNQSVPKFLFTRKESAFSLGISIRSLDYALAAKELKFRKIGKKVLIPAAELARYARMDHLHLTQHDND